MHMMPLNEFAVEVLSERVVQVLNNDPVLFMKDIPDY
jgi:hypothetical protein